MYSKEILDIVETVTHNLQKCAGFGGFFLVQLNKKASRIPKRNRNQASNKCHHLKMDRCITLPLKAFTTQFFPTDPLLHLIMLLFAALLIHLLISFSHKRHKFLLSCLLYKEYSPNYSKGGLEGAGQGQTAEPWPAMQVVVCCTLQSSLAVCTFPAYWRILEDIRLLSVKGSSVAPHDSGGNTTLSKLQAEQILGTRVGVAKQDEINILQFHLEIWSNQDCMP